MKSSLNILLVVFFLSATVCAAAPIYTWKDEEGHVHYSDQPFEGNEQVRETHLDTQMPAHDDGQPSASDEYSIRRQIEYFDQRREAQRQAWLDRQRLIQSAREQELQALQLQQQAELAEKSSQPTVIVTRPYYRPHHRHHPGFHRPTGVQPHSPYSLQLQQQGDHHRFNLNLGNPYPSYPLNFWKH